MKTAISIPDTLNESVETFLGKTGMSRSEFFQRAARLYLDRVAARAITANLDRVYSDAESTVDSAFHRAAISQLGDVAADEGW